MQKKWIAAVTAFMLMMTPLTVYADDNSLDEDYVEFMFGKLEDMDEKKKEKKKTEMEVSLSTKVFIDKLKDNWENKISETSKEELKAKGITEAYVEENIEKLKSWSVEDRFALINYASNGENDKLKALNKKYSGNDDSSNNNGGSSGGSGGSGGGSSSGSQSTNTPTEVVEEESVPQGAMRVADMQVSKGFISKSLSKVGDKSIDDFEDMKSHWSKEYVAFFVDSGVISGKSQATFDPDASITKAEVLTLLSKIIVENPAKLDSTGKIATDVEESAWYAEFANQMTSLGIAETDEEGSLNPKKTT